jgi:hypothetical protein
MVRLLAPGVAREAFVRVDEVPHVHRILLESLVDAGLLARDLPVQDQEGAHHVEEVHPEFGTFLARPDAAFGGPVGAQERFGLQAGGLQVRLVFGALVRQQQRVAQTAGQARGGGEGPDVAGRQVQRVGVVQVAVRRLCFDRAVDPVADDRDLLGVAPGEHGRDRHRLLPVVPLIRMGQHILHRPALGRHDIDRSHSRRLHFLTYRLVGIHLGSSRQGSEREETLPLPQQGIATAE